jgi:protein-S-isoprenylcysteine O-methyltransferase Ste14
MSYMTLSRILFICLMVNEAIVVVRSSPEERRNAPLPRLMPLTVLLLFLPLFFALDLPDWLGLLAVIGQAAGLLLEIAGEIQLSRARSFSVAPNAPIQPQAEGLYRWLENPIYVGIMLQFIAWSLWMPLVVISAALQYEAFRRAVTAERAELASVNFTLRKLDSVLWN